MKKKMLNKGDLGVDELEQDFLNEICHMRMEIAYKRLLQTRTHKEAKRTKERDEAIEELYQQVEKECTEEGKSYFLKTQMRWCIEKVKTPTFIIRVDFLME